MAHQLRVVTTFNNGKRYFHSKQLKTVTSALEFKDLSINHLFW